jgi:hypothetical protein
MTSTRPATTVRDWARRAWNSRLVSRPVDLSTPGAVILWWELRRVPYNVIVGATGIATCGIFLCTAVVCDALIGVPIGMSDGMGNVLILLAIPAYGVAANLGYTAGWAAELLVVFLAGRRPRHFAPTLFTLGTLFSIALTLLPAVLIVLMAALSVIVHFATGAPRGVPQ